MSQFCRLPVIFSSSKFNNSILLDIFHYELANLTDFPYHYTQIYVNYRNKILEEKHYLILDLQKCQ